MIVRSQQDQPRQDINWIGVVVDDAPTAFSLYQAVREALPSAFGPVAQTSGRANDNVEGDDSNQGRRLRHFHIAAEVISPLDP
jgi:hypothetical protein